MDIGKQLKDARISAGFTQENVAEKINVSRQTISNWENEKTYPDLISIIKLSDLYGISLDALLKGDKKMIEHLEESTNVVKSNQKLIMAVIINILVVIAFALVGIFQTENYAFLAVAFSVAIISSSFLLFQMIRKF
jgi:transcriptional regulator with XRE-family HTH domain